MGQSFIGGYYKGLFRKDTMIYLLVIGGIIGCIVSIYFVSQGGVAGWAQLWWWIPASTIFLGPVGLVILAIIAPILGYIAVGLLYALISVNSQFFSFFFVMFYFIFRHPFSHIA